MHTALRFLAILLLSATICWTPAGSAASAAQWVDLPERFRGVWAPDCSRTGKMFVLSGFGFVGIGREDGQTAFKTHAFSELSVRGDRVIELDPVSAAERVLTIGEPAGTLSMGEGAEYQRCSMQPTPVAAFHREWIQDLIRLDQAITACRNQPSDCHRRAARFVDQSDDGRIVTAEIAAALRRVAMVGEVAHANRAIDTESLLGVYTDGVLDGPRLARTLIGAFDVDDSGALTYDEFAALPLRPLLTDPERIHDDLPDHHDLADLANDVGGDG